MPRQVTILKKQHFQSSNNKTKWPRQVCELILDCDILDFCIFCIFCIFCTFFIFRLLSSSPFQKHITSQVCHLFLYQSLYLFLCLCLYLYFLRPYLKLIILRILQSSPFQKYITPQVSLLLPLFVSVFEFVSVYVFVFASVFEFSSKFGQLTSWAFRKCMV